jgi:hypothetical protein
MADSLRTVEFGIAYSRAWETCLASIEYSHC